MGAALTFTFLVPVALFVLVLLVVVILVDRRDDLDPEGRRPFAAYVFVVVFLTLFTTLFAVAAFVNPLVHLAIGDSDRGESRSITRPSETFSVNGSSIATKSSESDQSGPESFGDSGANDDARIREAVRAGLLAAAAGVVLAFHLGMARRAADDPDVGAGRARRIYHAYLYAVMALSVIIVIGAGTAFGYAVFKVIAPGVASSSGVGHRKAAVPELVTTAVLLAGAAMIFLYHFRRRPAQGTGPVPALPPAPDAFTPPPPEPGPEPEPEAAPPRRPPRKASPAKKTAPRRSTRGA